MESRKNKIAKNIVSSVSLNLFNIFIGFASRIIFLKILDIYYLGISSLFTNILGVLSLADLGLSTAMMYSLYKPIAENDTKKITDLIWFFRKIYLAIASVVFILGLSLIPFLKYIINMDVEIENIEFYYFISLLNIVISYLFVYRSILITADQKQYIVNKISFIFKIITFVAQVFVLIITKDYALYVVTAIILSLINNFILNHKAMKLYPYLKNKAEKLDVTEKNSIKENVKSLFMYKFAGTILSNTDNIFISIFVGTLTVGLYSNYILIVNQIISIISLAFTQLKATIGNMIFSDKSELSGKFSLFCRLELAIYWMVSFCSIALFVLMNDFVFIVFGEDFLLSNIIVLIIVLNFYTANIRQNIWVFRETTGIFKETKYITLITAILNLALSLLLGYFYGLAGILGATIISRMLYSWWKEAQILFKNVFKLSSKKYLLDYIKKLIICFIVGVFTYYIANFCMFENIVLSFILKVFVCSVVPNLLFFIIFYRTEEFKYFLKMLSNILKLKRLKQGEK